MAKNFIEKISNLSNAAIKEVEEFIDDLDKVPEKKENNSLDSRAADEFEKKIDNLLVDLDNSFDDFTKEHNLTKENMAAEINSLAQKFKTSVKEYNFDKLSKNFIIHVKDGFNELMKNIEEIFKKDSEDDKNIDSKKESNK